MSQQRRGPNTAPAAEGFTSDHRTEMHFGSSDRDETVSSALTLNATWERVGPRVGRPCSSSARSAPRGSPVCELRQCTGTTPSPGQHAAHLRKVPESSEGRRHARPWKPGWQTPPAVTRRAGSSSGANYKLDLILQEHSLLPATLCFPWK